MYCPDDAVSRGAMAAFMHRGFTRVATSAWSTSVTQTSDGDAAAVDTFTITPGIPSGALTGANGFFEGTRASTSSPARPAVRANSGRRCAIRRSPTTSTHLRTRQRRQLRDRSPVGLGSASGRQRRFAHDPRPRLFEYRVGYRDCVGRRDGDLPPVRVRRGPTCSAPPARPVPPARARHPVASSVLSIRRDRRCSD